MAKSKSLAKSSPKAPAKIATTHKAKQSVLTNSRRGSVSIWLIVLGVIVLLAFILVSWVIGKYNTLVQLDGEVINEWAQVETQYQRRADLIPNIVETVQGAADFEQSTLTEVTQARTNWLNTSADPDATIEDQMEASTAFDSAISRLLVTVESYPTLTATESFNTLIVELEGTENRIAVARQDYNDVATNYNITIKKFPMMIFAGFFDYEEHGLFESEEGSEDAVDVEFDF